LKLKAISRGSEEHVSTVFIMCGVFLQMNEEIIASAGLRTYFVK